MRRAFHTEFLELPLKDLSTGNTASITGAVVGHAPPTPLYHGAAYFDGSSRIEFDFDRWNQRDMLFVFWMSPGGSGIEDIFELTSGSNTVFKASLDYSDMSLDLETYSYTGSSYVTGTSSTAALSVTGGYWHHIAIAYSDIQNEITVYVDSEYGDAVSITNPIITKPDTLIIGPSFTGYLSDFEIFDSYVSPFDIQDYTNQTNTYVDFDQFVEGVTTEFYMRMDSDSFTTDDWNDEPVTISGSLTGVDSHFFDDTDWVDTGGTAYAYITDATKWDVGSDDFALGVWIQVDTATTIGSVQAIWGKGGRDAINGAGIFLETNGVVKFYANDGTNSASVGTTDIHDGKPHFVVAGKSGSDFFIYVDDNAVETVSVGSVGSLSNTTNNLTAGAHSNGTSNYEGYMKHAFAAKSVPTADHVLSSFEAGKFGVYRTAVSGDTSTLSESNYLVYSYDWQVYPANKGFDLHKE